MKLVDRLSRIKREVTEFWLNHFVAHIPIHSFRVLNYKLAGMHIGKNVRILMGLYICYPKKIYIGDNTVINEFVVINACGGKVIIGDNSSISVRTMIYSGTHDTNSNTFEFIEKDTILADHVWTGINSVILPGCIFPSGMILAAGSVAIPQKNDAYEQSGIYSGVPAIQISKRKSDLTYQFGYFKPLLK